jgi:hypothetical protein
MKQQISVFLLLLIAVVSLPADDGALEFRFGPRIFGATLDTRYVTTQPAEDDVETSVTARLSSAYENVGFHRSSTGSLLYIDPAIDSAITGYDRFDLLWELGLQQGILPRGDTTQDAAVVFTLYRGRYRLPFAAAESELLAENLPPVDQTLQGSVISGIAYSTVTRAAITREQEGLFGELAIEWAPEFLHNAILGSGNYNRLTLKGSGFLPLIALDPRDGRNRFSLYLAGFGVVDWATGPDIPISVRNTTGGRGLRGAPGGSVRGFGSGRFDSTFKAIASVELRAALPAIVLPSIIPGVVLFSDFGFYSDLDELSPILLEHSGFLGSSGIGLSIDLFDAVTLVFYSTIAWSGDTRSGDMWTPFGVGFGYHF